MGRSAHPRTGGHRDTVTSDDPRPDDGRPGGPPLRDLVHDLDAIVWEYDLRADAFTFVSGHAETLLGHPASAWRDFAFWQGLIHPDDRERAVSFCRAQTEVGRDHDFEYRAVAADGRIVWLRDIVRLVRDADGGLARLRGVMVDVTDRRRRAEAAAAAERIAAGMPPDDPASVWTDLVREACALVDGRGAALTRPGSGRPVVLLSVGAGAGVRPPRSLLVAAADGATVRDDDLAGRDDPDARRLAAEGVAACVAAPLGAAGAPWAVLVVHLDGPASPLDAEVLSEFAARAGLAVAHAEAAAALRVSVATEQHQAAENRALADIAIAVAEDRPPREVFAVTAEACARALQADLSGVFRFRGDGIEFQGLFNTRDRGSAEDLAVQAAGPLDRMRRTGRPVRLSPGDLRGGDGVGDRIRAEGAVSVVIAPVHVAGRLWGGVGVATRGAPLPPDAEDRLEAFARLAATAVSHADARARLVRQATTDGLTGLANHRRFQEQLRVEIARARRHDRPLSLVLIDLDEFHRINDAHGHEAGDRILTEAAARLRELVRPGDLLARLGGDEFAWILAETGAMEAYAAAERARLAIVSRPFQGLIHLNASAGVCGIEEAEGAEQLIRLADGALYWAKSNGRGVTYRYSPEVVRELSAAERAARLARQQALAGLRALARAVDAKDHDTREHSDRVAVLAERLAGELGWEPDRIAALTEAALLHDVGKIGIRDAVLFKAGRLTEAEFAQVQQHAALGAVIAAEVLSPEQVSWIRGHHERHDGTGYPDGLAGEAIPDGARILALADAWDVMTTVRSYKEAMPSDAALAECVRHAGGQFEPAAVEALRALWDRGALRVPDRPPVTAEAG